jgi:hypothetical protein
MTTPRVSIGRWRSNAEILADADETPGAHHEYWRNKRDHWLVWAVRFDAQGNPDAACGPLHVAPGKADVSLLAYYGYGRPSALTDLATLLGNADSFVRDSSDARDD